MGTILFSLIIANCPLNVSDVNAKSCELTYHSGGYSAQECIMEQGAFMGRVTAKGLPSTVALCWEERGTRGNAGS
jgi:hypothetical protein